MVKLPLKNPSWCPNGVKNNITVIIPNKEANRNSKSLHIKTLFHKCVFYYLLREATFKTVFSNDVWIDLKSVIWVLSLRVISQEEA